MLRPRPGQGGVRHRDPRAGHQHARPHRRPRAAGQVERRGARRRHAGGVHPAHRPGRAPRHRRRGPRRRRLGARAWTRRVVAGLASTRTYPLRVVVPARATTWRSTWSARFGRARGPGAARRPRSRQFQADRSVVGLARAAARHEQDAAPVRRRDALRPRRRRPSTPQLRRQIGEREKELSRDSQAKRRMEAAEALARAAARRRHPRCRRDGGRGWPSSWTRGSPTSPTRARWCSPRTSGPAGWARSTSRRR